MLPILIWVLLASFHPAIAWSGYPRYPNSRAVVVDTGPITQDVIDDATKKEMRARSDCAWATIHKPYSYVECLSQSSWNELNYTVTATGTGQNAARWANKIVETVRQTCAKSRSDCVNEDTAARNLTKPAYRTYAIDHFTRKVFANDGFQIKFHFEKPGAWVWGCPVWNDDANHRCVTEAIRKATCYDVGFPNGLACRKLDYYGDNYLPEGSETYGHPYIDDYDDNLAGPGY